MTTPPSPTDPAARAEQLRRMHDAAREFVVVAHRSAVSVAGVLPTTYGTPEQRQAHVFLQVAAYLADHGCERDDSLAARARGLADGFRAIGLIR